MVCACITYIGPDQIVPELVARLCFVLRPPPEGRNLGVVQRNGEGESNFHQFESARSWCCLISNVGKGAYSGRVWVPQGVVVDADIVHPVL
jgi:hypothetical protein